MEYQYLLEQCPPGMPLAEWLAEQLPHCWLEAYATMGERTLNILRVVHGTFTYFFDLVSDAQVRQIPPGFLRVGW